MTSAPAFCCCGPLCVGLFPRAKEAVPTLLNGRLNDRYRSSRAVCGEVAPAANAGGAAVCWFCSGGSVRIRTASTASTVRLLCEPQTVHRIDGAVGQGFRCLPDVFGAAVVTGQFATRNHPAGGEACCIKSQHHRHRRRNKTKETFIGHSWSGRRTGKLQRRYC